MITARFKAAAALAAASIFTAGAANGAPSPAAAADAMVGNYRLFSFTVEPTHKNWFFTKGRLQIKRLDQKHLLIQLACEWKGEPKAQCWEWTTARQGSDGIFLVFKGNDAQKMRFDPATRTLTVTMEGGNATRTDVYVPDDSPVTDPALLRRFRHGLASFEGTIKDKNYGHYRDEDYTKTRIYP